MRSTADSYCRAIGKQCPLKTIPVADGEDVDTTLRYLVIEPSTACDLKCLACPVRLDLVKRVVDEAGPAVERRTCASSPAI